jgi:type VI secretion system secreted protein Hcp
MAIYLKLGDFKGEVDKKGGKHKEWISIDTWGLGASRQATASEKGMQAPGHTQLDNLTITKEADLSSPSLFRYCLQGPSEGKGKDATIELEDSTKDKNIVLTIKLKDAVITSYRISNNKQSTGETITMAFSEINMIYTPAEGGKNEMKYDLKNKSAS